jgi:hypothetical protein
LDVVSTLEVGHAKRRSFETFLRSRCGKKRNASHASTRDVHALSGARHSGENLNASRWTARMTSSYVLLDCIPSAVVVHLRETHRSRRRNWTWRCSLGIQEFVNPMKIPFLVCTVLVGSSIVTLAPAQSQANARPITGPVRDAGTYHIATGTWTRSGAIGLGQLGSEVIFDNTCPTGYFSALSGDTFTDEGRLPALESLDLPGCNHAYVIDGFEIGYCTDQPTGEFDIDFYAAYTPCLDPVVLTPVASFALSGLPGGPTGIACWTVTIDLDGATPGTQPFVIPAEGGDGPGTALDHFGWSFSSSSAGQQSTGFLIAGDPSTCAVGAGTVFDPMHVGPGTGLGAADSFFISNGPTAPGCYFFGGPGSGPFASFQLRLFSNDPCGPIGNVVCAGDGSGTACPCNNNSSPSDAAGCINSLGQAGTLRAVGDASLATDTLSLRTTNVPDGGNSFYFQGTSLENGGAGITFGDGLRCAGGALARIKFVPISGGASRYPVSNEPSISDAAFVTTTGTRYYQVYYHDAATFCMPRGFNFTNALEIVWGL